MLFFNNSNAGVTLSMLHGVHLEGVDHGSLIYSTLLFLTSIRSFTLLLTLAMYFWLPTISSTSLFASIATAADFTRPDCYDNVLCRVRGSGPRLIPINRVEELGQATSSISHPTTITAAPTSPRQELIKYNAKRDFSLGRGHSCSMQIIHVFDATQTVTVFTKSDCPNLDGCF